MLLKLSNAMWVVSGAGGMFLATAFSANGAPEWFMALVNVTCWVVSVCALGGLAVRGVHYTYQLVRRAQQRHR